MTWDMEIDAIESVLEKIWDLHDKLSDAIHSISRAHFLNSIKSLNKPSPPSSDGCGGDGRKKPPFVDFSATTGTRNGNNNGFVYVKDCGDVDYSSAIVEAKSLNAIRTALENLEDQLEFFHTVQIQQRAERDAAIARIEQSRIILALRLAEHHGKRYKVIEEAMDFVGDVRGGSNCFISPENLSCPQASAPSADHFMHQRGLKPNLFTRILSSGFDCAKKALKFESNVGSIMGNAALFTISMFAFFHLHRVSCKNQLMLEFPCQKQGGRAYSSAPEAVGGFECSSSSSGGEFGQLDVLAARG